MSDRCGKKPPAACHAERRSSLSSDLWLWPACASSWQGIHSETGGGSRSMMPGTPSRTSRPSASLLCRSRTGHPRTWPRPWTGFDRWSDGICPSCCVCLNPECWGATCLPSRGGNTIQIHRWFSPAGTCWNQNKTGRGQPLNKEVSRTRYPRRKFAPEVNSFSETVRLTRCVTESQLCARLSL